MKVAIVLRSTEHQPVSTTIVWMRLCCFWACWLVIVWSSWQTCHTCWPPPQARLRINSDNITNSENNFIISTLFVKTVIIVTRQPAPFSFSVTTNHWAPPVIVHQNYIHHCPPSYVVLHHRHPSSFFIISHHRRPPFLITIRQHRSSPPATAHVQSSRSALHH